MPTQPLSGVRLDHLVRPAAAEPRGALVLLHGRGADEHDLVPLIDLLDPRRELVAITPGAPLALPPGGRHWYVVPRVGFPEPETFTASLAMLRELLGAVTEQLAIPASRIVLGGFSQGAVMSYALALDAERPAPAALAALSGFIPTVEGWQPSLADRTSLPVWIAHGSRDPVISVDFARQARDLLAAGGFTNVAYHESEAAHHIDPRTLLELTRWVSDAVEAAGAEG